MPRNDEGQSAHGYAITARDARAHRGFRRHVLEKRNGRKAHTVELLNVGGPRNRVGHGGRYRGFLIEGREWRFEAAREPERPKCKGPLGVDEMAQSLPDTPFF